MYEYTTAKMMMKKAKTQVMPSFKMPAEIKKR